MILPKVALGLTGVLFVALGVAFLVAPERMAAIVELDVRRARPLAEIRAMYGGFELGLGTFFLVAATRVRWIRAALAAQFLGLGGLAFGRLSGLLLGAPTDRLMLAFAGIEIAGATLGLIAYRQAKHAMMNRGDFRLYEPRKAPP